jgi:hypothetical protein
MRSTALIAATMLSLAMGSALAQTTASPPVARPGNPIGTGQSLPISNKAGNTNLPAPPVSADAPPRAFLQAARTALTAGRTGEAQDALEMAETRALDRSVAPSQAGTSSQQPLVKQISDALKTLLAGDNARTLQLIDAALSNPDAGPSSP